MDVESMKNNICFSKKTVFVSFVIIVMIGFVLFARYLTNTKQTILTRAQLKKPNGGKSYILGGKNVKPGEFPYVAYISFYDRTTNKKSNCTGILIKKNWLLTAAHCLQDTDEYGTIIGKWEEIYVDINQTKISEINLIKRAIPIIYPKYDFLLNVKDDIGLLYFDNYLAVKPVSFPDPKVTLILANPENNLLNSPPPDVATVIGWGVIKILPTPGISPNYSKYRPNFDVIPADKLQSLDLFIYGCGGVSSPSKDIIFRCSREYNFALQPINQNQSPFWGDSGAPVLNSKKQLIGIISTVKPKNLINDKLLGYSTAVNISKYSYWIDSMTNQQYCKDQEYQNLYPIFDKAKLYRPSELKLYYNTDKFIDSISKCVLDANKQKTGYECPKGKIDQVNTIKKAVDGECVKRVYDTER